MRTCPNTSRLTALREGWLKQSDVRSLLAHLEECPTCRETMAELDAVVGLVNQHLGQVEAPPGGYDALLRSTLAMWERLPVPVRRMRAWVRRSLAAAAAIILLSTVIVVADRSRRSSSGQDNAAAEVSSDSVELLDFMIEEHALATDQVPFSDGAYLAVKAEKGGR